MLVTILYRAEGEPEVSFENIPFGDIAIGSYYEEAVIWAAEKGIVSGYDANKFAPNSNITRQQMAAIMYRYAKYKGYDASVGKDTNIALVRFEDGPNSDSDIPFISSLS